MPFQKGYTPWNKGKRGIYSLETRRKISEYQRGRKHEPCSQETKLKISLATMGKNKGKIRSIKTRRKIGQGLFESKSYAWKGEDVGYVGLHNWVRRRLGKPTKCEFCSKDGLTGKQIHWANKSHLYKRDLEDWIRLCVSCHKKYDSKK